jgi:hypothetical protein
MLYDVLRLKLPLIPLFDNRQDRGRILVAPRSSSRCRMESRQSSAPTTPSAAVTPFLAPLAATALWRRTARHSPPQHSRSPPDVTALRRRIARRSTPGAARRHWTPAAHRLTLAAAALPVRPAIRRPLPERRQSLHGEVARYVP